MVDSHFADAFTDGLAIAKLPAFACSMRVRILAFATLSSNPSIHWAASSVSRIEFMLLL
jgi:hypothetical protein